MIVFPVLESSAPVGSLHKRIVRCLAIALANNIN